jgi:hypothetical protein
MRTYMPNAIHLDTLKEIVTPEEEIVIKTELYGYFMYLIIRNPSIQTAEYLMKHEIEYLYTKKYDNKPGLHIYIDRIYIKTDQEIFPVNL